VGCPKYLEKKMMMKRKLEKKRSKYQNTLEKRADWPMGEDMNIWVNILNSKSEWGQSTLPNNKSWFQR